MTAKSKTTKSPAAAEPAAIDLPVFKSPTPFLRPGDVIIYSARAGAGTGRPIAGLFIVKGFSAPTVMGPRLVDLEALDGLTAQDANLLIGAGGTFEDILHDAKAAGQLRLFAGANAEAEGVATFAKVKAAFDKRYEAALAIERQRREAWRQLGAAVDVALHT